MSVRTSLAIAPLLVARVVLTNAQVKALPTTPVTLIAAPPSGYRLNVLCASLVKRAGSGAYTNINTTYSGLSLETGGAAWLTNAIVNDDDGSPTSFLLTRLTDFLGGANEKLGQMGGPLLDAITNGVGLAGYTQPSVGSALSDYDGQLVRLAVDNNGSGDFTGGNAANTLGVTVYYTLEMLL